MDSGTWFVVGFIWLVAAAVGWLVLYWTVRLAVSHAIRQNTASSRSMT